MAKILVRIKEDSAVRVIEEVLAAEGHEIISDLPSVETNDELSALAGAIVEKEPELIIIDFNSEDAGSVKLLQEATLQLPYVKFVFILAGNESPGQLVMALNEGAVALLHSPLDPGAVSIYTSRALARRRLEMERDVEIAHCKELIDHEKACSMDQAVEINAQKRLLKNYQRLINHLLVANPPRNPKTILLVSDSDFQLDLFRKPLADHNFTVITAGDGKAGLDKAKEEKPRIIVSDMEMPGLNGVELCKAVKNDDTLAPNYFIICTANQNKIDDILRPVNKVDDCLLKPSRPDEFQEFISRVALGLII